ncbi:DUF6776 family protein [Marinicella pacifica]|uniref:DUF6776 family protein n=1 Tax=Marinicella pacifica TaxID=1171543 RepID=UPI0016678F20|nr:DUF6776 family protein [Marinicella pacifica]
MSTKSPKYIIRAADENRSFIRRHWLLVSLVLLVVAAFFYGRYYDIDVLKAFKGQKQTWTEVNQQLTEENQQQSVLISRLQTELKVKDQALQTLKLDLDRLNQEIIQLKADVGFYENLLSHKDSIKTLRVFEAIAKPAANYIQLKIVLAQKLEKARTKSGTLSVNLLGIQNDKAHQIDLIKQFELDNHFSFKYFQIKNYAITLPDGFIPTTLLVELQSDDNRPKIVTERLAWQDVWQATSGDEKQSSPNPKPNVDSVESN